MCVCVCVCVCACACVRACVSKCLTARNMVNFKLINEVLIF